LSISPVSIAQVRHAKQPPATFFAEGNLTLDPREVQAAGDVRGYHLLHLQCSTGEDTLSWSILGADATGVDISEEQIKLAQQKAAAAGLSTHFIAAVDAIKKKIKRCRCSPSGFAHA